MDNRDFYNKPLQGGGRDSYDYGNSGFIHPEHNHDEGFWTRWGVPVAILACIGFWVTIGCVFINRVTG